MKRKYLTNEDFEECEFINQQMRFLTYYDFVREAARIKKCFESMPDRGKVFYMWYLYANIHMNETYKNICWDYLNGYIVYGELKFKERFYKIR